MSNRQERPDRNDCEYSEDHELREKMRPVPLLVALGEETKSTQTRRGNAFHI